MTMDHTHDDGQTTTMTHSTSLSRTFQTAPAGVPRENSAKYLESGFTRTGFEVPDWLVPDLEDGTAPGMKAEARDNIVALVPEQAPTFTGEIWPRVQWAYDDAELREQGTQDIETLVQEVGEHLDGFVVPKVGGLADVERADATIGAAEEEYGFRPGTFGLSVIVETARARSELGAIARYGRESRLGGLVFGPVDYTAELGGRTIRGESPVWHGLLEALSNEASANGLVSIGGPFDQLFSERAGVRTYNSVGYVEHVEREAGLGFDGSWSLHPNQTVQANYIHMPTPEELDRDLTRVEEFERARADGTGAITSDGQMVDEATYKNFVNTVERVRALLAKNDEQARQLYDTETIERVEATGN